MRKCVILAIIIYLLILAFGPKTPTDKDYKIPDRSGENNPLPPDTVRYYKPIFPPKKKIKQVEIAEP